MAYTLALEDKILDGLVAKIARHRDADVIVDPNINFTVERDRSVPLQGLSVPTVIATLEADAPDGPDYSARYQVLCVVPANDAATAAVRLAILKEQVRVALLDRTDRDLGQAVGAVGTIKKPSWSRVEFGVAALDSTLLAGMWSIEISYAYQPKPITGTALAELGIDTGRFKALYTFP